MTRVSEAGWLLGTGLAIVCAFLAARAAPERISAEAAALRTENAASEAVRTIREEAASGASGRIVPEGLEMLRRDGTAIRFEVDGNTLFARSPGVDTALLEGVESAVFWYEDGGEFIGAEIVVRDRGASAPRTLHARIPTLGREGDRLARAAQRRRKPR